MKCFLRIIVLSITVKFSLESALLLISNYTNSSGDVCSRCDDLSQ